MSDWNSFPYENSAYRYEGDKLRDCWAELHRGDRVEFPGEDQVRETLGLTPSAAPDGFDGDVPALAARLQEAWRCFHHGDFQRATELGRQCGPLGHGPANKAEGIYATYLETDDAVREAHYLAAVKRAETAIELMPYDPNGHYFRAFNLGRYSQCISVVKALRKGIGGKILDSLQTTLGLQPEHAEAHTALGMYHAEIVDKVGKMLGRVTYGASADEALEHFQRALELTPESPIALIEYGNGLYLLFGDERLDEVTDLYVRATELTAIDAMQKLDIEAALAELE